MSEFRSTLRNQSLHNVFFSQGPQPSPTSHYTNLDGSNISLTISNVLGHPTQQISSPRTPNNIEDNNIESYRVPQSARLPRDKAALITDNFQRLEIATRGKQRSDNSLRDLNRSLANLGRNESSPSIELLLGKTTSIFKEGNIGPKLSSFQPISPTDRKHSQTINSNSLFKPSRTPTSKDEQQNNPLGFIYYTENSEESQSNEFAPPKKGKYNSQGYKDRSSAKINNLQPRDSQIDFEDYQRRFSSNFQPKFLLTEEDSIIEQSDLFSERLSEKLFFQTEDLNNKNEKQIEKESISAKQDFHKNINPSNKINLAKINMEPQKSNSEGKGQQLFLKQSQLIREKLKSDKDALNLLGYGKHLNQDILDLDNISHGVKYTEGGVGYGINGRKTNKEYKALPRDSDRSGKQKKQVKKRKGQSVPRGRRLTEVEKGTIDTWKRDLLEIKNDMDRRKPSYERVNSFLKKYDKKQVSIPKAGSKDLQDTVNRFTEKSSPYLQKTQHTLHTEQTQLDHIISPSFCATNNAQNIPNLSVYETLPNRDKSREKFRDTRGILEIKTTEDVDEQRMQKEETVIPENQFGFRVISDQGVNRRMYDVNLGSFIQHGNVGCRIACKSPCCSASSGCNMF